MTVAFATPDRNRRVSQKRFCYYRCGSCGTLALVPAPADLDRYYPVEYYAFPSDRRELLVAAEGERYKLEIVSRFAPLGRLVEIGPSVGGFAALAQEAGYDTSAIEMDSACCRFLRETVGIVVYETAAPASALAAHGPFDVVAMWHVIEHLPDPRGALAAAASSLRPGGVLVLAAPNPNAFQFRVFGSRWTHVDAPRHLFLIPSKALIGIARNLGLEVALLTTSDPGTLGWNRFGWRESLANFTPSPYARRALRLVGSLAARAMGPFDRRDHSGSTYTLVLRRPLAG
jgi:SAM-dependent methyltransferase